MKASEIFRIAKHAFGKCVQCRVHLSALIMVGLVEITLFSKHHVFLISLHLESEESLFLICLL